MKRSSQWGTLSCILAGAATCIFAGTVMDFLALSDVAHPSDNLHVAIAVACGFLGMFAWAWRLDREAKRIEREARFVSQRFLDTQRRRARWQ